MEMAGWLVVLLMGGMSVFALIDQFA